MDFLTSATVVYDLKGGSTMLSFRLSYGSQHFGVSSWHMSCYSTTSLWSFAYSKARKQWVRGNGAKIH